MHHTSALYSGSFLTEYKHDRYLLNYLIFLPDLKINFSLYSASLSCCYCMTSTLSSNILPGKFIFLLSAVLS